MEDDDFVEKTYEFAQDTTKQLITLASAIVALTITFYKDFATGASGCSRNLMGVAWVIYFLSILGGIGTLFQLTGKLAKKKRDTTDIAVVISSGIQQGGFLIALIVTIVAGWLAIGNTNTPAPIPAPVTTSNAPGPTSEPKPLPPAPRPDTAPTPDIAPTPAPAPLPPPAGQ